MKVSADDLRYIANWLDATDGTVHGVVTITVPRLMGFSNTKVTFEVSGRMVTVLPDEEN